MKKILIGISLAAAATGATAWAADHAGNHPAGHQRVVFDQQNMQEAAPIRKKRPRPAGPVFNTRLIGAVHTGAKGNGIT